MFNCNRYSSINAPGDSPWGLPSPSPSATTPPADEKTAAAVETPDTPAWPDLPPRPEQARKEDHWMLEILSLALSCVCLGLLIYMLYRINGKPQSYWTIYLEPNTIISIGAFLIEALAAFPILTGLGQLKWIKYKKRARSLAEIQMFDDASRRSIGGLLRVGLGRGGVFAAVGVWIIFCIMAISPFTQQVLTVPLKYVATDKPAYIVRALSYSDWYGAVQNMAAAPLPMKAAAYDALYGYSANVPLKNPYSSCPTSNCTWPGFLSLGVCSECTDLSPLISIIGTCDGSSLDCTYSLPSEYGNFALYQYRFGLSMINVTTLDNSPSIHDQFPDAQDPIIEYLTINTTAVSDNKMTASAWDCKLRFCVQNIEAKVVNGTFSQSVSQAYPEVNLTVRTLPIEQEQYESYVFYIPGQGSFVVSSLAWYPISGFFSSIFTGSLGYSGDGTPGFSSDAVQALWASGDIPGVSGALATSMSTRIREASPMFPFYNLTSNQVINGTSYAFEPFFSVDWAWMALPLAAITLAWIFFFSVVEASRHSQARIWKSSLLPLLFHGLCDESKAHLNDADFGTIGSMKKHAKNIAVQLQDAAGKSVLSLDEKHTQSLKKKNRVSSWALLAPTYDHNQKDAEA